MWRLKWNTDFTQNICRRSRLWVLCMCAIAPIGQNLLNTPAHVATPSFAVSNGQTVAKHTHKIIKNLVKISIMFVLCIHLHNQTWWEWYNLGWIWPSEPFGPLRHENEASFYLQSCVCFILLPSGGADVSDVDVLPVWLWLTQTLSNVVLGDDDTDYTID